MIRAPADPWDVERSRELTELESEAQARQNQIMSVAKYISGIEGTIF